MHDDHTTETQRFAEKHSAAKPQPKYRRADLKLRRSRMFIDNHKQMTVSSFRSEMFKRTNGLVIYITLLKEP